MIAAVVPACGLSQRMGRPKLTLPLAGTPLLGHVVRAFREGGAGPVVVVVPGGRDRDPERIAAAEAEGAIVLETDPRPEAMRDSVQAGIDHLASLRGAWSGLLVSPGDCVGITPDVVRRMIERFEAGDVDLVAPTWGGRRGHPILLSSATALRLRELPVDRGLNALYEKPGLRWVALPVDEPGILVDVDTPEDYDRLADGG